MISTDVLIDTAGGGAKSRPAPGGLFMPQRNQRAAYPQAPEQGPATKAGRVLCTQPVFHPG